MEAVKPIFIYLDLIVFILRRFRIYINAGRINDRISFLFHLFSMQFSNQSIICNLFQKMSSKRKSHPMKILSDNQLYPSNKPIFSQQSSGLFPHFPVTTQNFLPPHENEEEQEMTERTGETTESAKLSELTNAKSNNDSASSSNSPAHREAMNQILKKLALKSQENLRKSKEENSRYVVMVLYTVIHSIL